MNALRELDAEARELLAQSEELVVMARGDFAEAARAVFGRGTEVRMTIQNEHQERQEQGTPERLFLFTDDHDTVVASDMQDAEEVWGQHQGSTYEAAVGDRFEECWRQVEDDKVITIHNDEGGETRTRTASEWAASNGRGFLCSTDY